MSQKPPRKSAPAPPGFTRKTVTLRDETWDRVDAYRHANRIKSEREAVQRIVDAGLDAGTSGIASAMPVTGARAKGREGDE